MLKLYDLKNTYLENSYTKKKRLFTEIDADMKESDGIEYRFDSAIYFRM